MKILSVCECWFTKIIYVLLAAVFAVMIILVALQVISRYFFPTPLAWTEELVRMLMGYVIFFGTVAVYNAHEHVWVNNLLDAVPKAPRRIMLLFAYIAQFFFCGLLLWGAVEFFPIASMQGATALPISKGWFYICVPISALFTLVFVIRDFIREVILGHELADTGREELIDA